MKFRCSICNKNESNDICDRCADDICSECAIEVMINQHQDELLCPDCIREVEIEEHSTICNIIQMIIFIVCFFSFIISVGWCLAVPEDGEAVGGIALMSFLLGGANLCAMLDECIW